MNLVENFIQTNRERLQLARYHIPEKLQTMMLTPRFPASSHVIFMMIPQGQSDPMLVAKVHRLKEISHSVDREVENLLKIAELFPNETSAFPRIIAHENFQNHSLLLETALQGSLLAPATLRKNPEGYTAMMIDWLLKLQKAESRPSAKSWYDAIAGEKIEFFKQTFPLNSEERSALEQVEEHIQVLKEHDLPFVVEHGDLSHPNLILLKQGGMGVVDWELSEIEGMLAYDLFFFLSYVTFTLHDSNNTLDYRTPFLKMFFGEDAQAKPHIKRYAEALNIPLDLLPPLFLLSWTRYLINLLIRLRLDDDIIKQTSEAVADDLRRNRYYELWRLSIDHYSELNIY